jgi:hypothetical protein
MRPLFAFLLCGLFHFAAPAQNKIWQDSVTTLAASTTEKFHDLLRLHEPVIYIAPVPGVTPLASRNLKLLEGEGKKGYWLEANLMHRFIIAKWNNRHRPWWQRNRITFDGGVTLRMTRDISSPLLPGNNRFGFGVDHLLHRTKKMNEDHKAVWWLTTQVHHYSNGQSGRFFLDTNKVRNNYRSGDFSTNYLRLMFMHANRSSKNNLYTVGLGYQREINIGGPLVLNDELMNYYGRNRLLGNFQWLRHPAKKKKTFPNKSGDAGFDKIPAKYWLLLYRTEMEYIFDNVSLYPRSNAYRFGWHNYLMYFFNMDNELGLMAHTYVGRDYLNVRFDDPVFIFQLGIVIKPMVK